MTEKTGDDLAVPLVSGGANTTVTKSLTKYDQGWFSGFEAGKRAAQDSLKPVYVVCTGEVFYNSETYQLFDGKPPPLCDYEVLYRKKATT